MSIAGFSKAIMGLLDLVARMLFHSLGFVLLFLCIGFVIDLFMKSPNGRRIEEKSRTNLTVRVSYLADLVLRHDS